MHTKTWLRVTAAWMVLLAAAGALAGCGGGAVEALPTTSLQLPTMAPTTSVAPAPAESAPPTTEPIAVTVPATPPGRTGVFVTAPGSTAVVGSGSTLTYSVEVEESLGLDPAEVAEVVDRTLADPRSWTADGSTAFQRVETGARVKIIVASPATVDSRCLPLNTAGILSCRSGSSVNINSDRWAGATADWSLDLDAYRSYVVNHEVGHVLGHGHESCGGQGSLAPVMMQQTKGLGGCAGNPWPFP